MGSLLSIADLSNETLVPHNAQHDSRERNAMRPQQKPLHPDMVTGEAHEEVQREALRRTADLLARILDTVITIPGTNVRIGLDPVIGLLPGIGDALASLIGSAILVMATQLQVPKIVMVRMGLNLAMNGVVGAIPVAGDLFSIWFKSNARNAALLRRHSSPEARTSTTADWAFVIAILVTTLALTLGAIAGILWLVARIWNLVA